MKARRPLTPRSIDALPAAPKGKRVLIWDATIQGFAVRITDTGSKSFVLVTRHPGDKHPSPRSIGTVGAISLAKAREKAIAWLEAIADGIDPPFDPSACCKPEGDQRSANAGDRSSEGRCRST